MENKCCVHDDIINITRGKMPDQEQLIDLAEFFKMFADSTRIGIICALFNKEMCVGDIAAVLNMGQSAISHQLRLLRTSGLVRSRRDGKTIYYSLDDEHIYSIFGCGLCHILEVRGEA